MTQTFPILSRLFSWRGSDLGALSVSEELYRRDPLAHPDIKRMTAREIADLQFHPGCFKSE